MVNGNRWQRLDFFKTKKVSVKNKGKLKNFYLNEKCQFHFIILTYKFCIKYVFISNHFLMSVDTSVEKLQNRLKTGMDSSLCMSYPQPILVERPDWMDDKETDTCVICNAAFSLINRRHHCRRCGRVLCGKCC